ncbi:hypothetical protein BC834DRAFT_819395, partial [Gloeopeniophorella convolvens]
VDSQVVYIKDCWRIDLPGLVKEGDTYRRLGEKKVPNVPDFGRDWDVCRHGGVVQRTQTQDFVDSLGCTGSSAMPHIHYRMVLKTVGRPLREFESTYQLCRAIRDAIVGHAAAFQDAEVLHRDISANNILISKGGGGLLIDWDLSISAAHAEVQPPELARHSRGTWRFLSINRLMRPQASPHTLADDLESFFWVLFYHVVRYQNTPLLSDGETRATFKKVFDDRVPQGDGRWTGGMGKLVFLHNTYAYFSKTVLELRSTHPAPS